MRIKGAEHNESDGDYAFEMISSTLRFGRGVSAEIGYDVQNLRAKSPLIVTDRNVAATRAFTYLFRTNL